MRNSPDYTKLKMDHLGTLLLLLLLLLLLRFSTSRSITREFSINGYDAAFNATAPEESWLELFEQWRVRHDKVYAHPSEKAQRFQSFRENLAYIVDRNAKRASTSHTVGLNAFADLSNEEFRSTYLSRVRQPGGKRMQGKEDSCEAPYSLDWRKKGVVTGVKNQGSCGSCWAFSSTGSMEGINAITTGELISLSEQELVDCDTTNEGCSGGYMDYAFEWTISNGGIDTESNYPYTGLNGICDVEKENIKVVTIDGYQDVAPKESALLCAVVQQPVSVGIDGSSLDFQLYTGGIFDGNCSSNPDDIDHAVLIVGYASQGNTDYWIVKNSWGTDWGIQGYFYIRRNTKLPYGVCAINAMASYPTKELISPTPFPSPVLPTPPPPPPPPPPPRPSPIICGDMSYCTSGETCCCIFEFRGFCFLYGCCGYENAVCCAGSVYCCPQDYPICDIKDGVCLQNNVGSLALAQAAKKLKLAKHKLPWTKFEGVHDGNHPLLRRDRLEAFL